ncbi:MAG TPA: hypothetical protein VMD25_00275 [Acidobacteriaceae bacterium]|nr:hypothetical protein [Acidobacteriaceae bacterium]
MPCLEIKVAVQRMAAPVTRLRTLLEKPGAAVLRRNFLAEAPGHDDPDLHARLRVTAVLAVDLTDPPRESQPPSPPPEDPEKPQSESPSRNAADPLAASFAKGLEIWITDGARLTCVHADIEEIAGALAMFDAYLRLARYQPAFQRLDQRILGLSFAFREGLTLGVAGSPGDAAQVPEYTFTSISAIPEIDDSRDTPFVIRFPDAGIAFVHELLRSASAWLEENSYPNILGSK